MQQTSRFKHSQYIGIDPDTSKSGVAVISTYTEKDPEGYAASIRMSTMDFHTLIQFLRRNDAGDMLVAIEKCWATTANWHLPKACTPNAAAKIGLNTGKCHMVGILLEEYCLKNEVNHALVEPLRKIWGPQRNSKISHGELMQVLRSMHIRYIGPNRTNQEERDAALIALTRR